jgi:hypothetical protein
MAANAAPPCSARNTAREAILVGISRAEGIIPALLQFILRDLAILVLVLSLQRIQGILRQRTVQMQPGRDAFLLVQDAILIRVKLLGDRRSIAARPLEQALQIVRRGGLRSASDGHIQDRKGGNSRNQEGR